MGSKDLERLEELTPQLKPPVTLPLLIKDVSKEAIEYKISGGEAFGFALYNNGEVAVQRAYMSKGACFSSHIHPGCREWLLCYSGSILMRIQDIPDKTLLPGDGSYVDSDIAHECEALEDSWVIGITVPAGEGYPHV